MKMATLIVSLILAASLLGNGRVTPIQPVPERQMLKINKDELEIRYTTVSREYRRDLLHEREMLLQDIAQLNEDLAEIDAKLAVLNQ